MYIVPWIIDFAFPYPSDCTRAQLLVILRRLAADWPGWPNFPWRVTRSIHKFLGRPPENFHYLMIHQCLMGFAAHLVLTAKFEDREAVLAMILREKFEIAGVLRVLLIDAIRSEMRFRKMSEIRDCSGPEDGRAVVPAEELATRRRDFQESVEGAVNEFVMILNLASQTENMNEWLLGRPLRQWARGGDMPEAVTLTVQMEDTAEGKVARPCHKERMLMMGAGRTLPAVLVERKKGGGQRSEGGGQTLLRQGYAGQGSEGGERSKALKRGSVGVDDQADGIDRIDGLAGGAPRQAAAAKSGAEAPHSKAADAADGDAAAPASVQLREKRAAAGRERSMIKNLDDREAIRVEVARLRAPPHGLSQREACRQVAEQAQKGRAGQKRLTMKYNLAGSMATTAVVRRVVTAGW